MHARDAAATAGPRVLLGERDGGVLRGGTTARKGPTTKIVCLGTGERRGIAGHEPGLRLRVRYRLSRAVPLGVQVTETGHGRSFQAAVAAPRAGLWTELDLDLDRFVDEAREGRALAPGDRLDLVTVSAHGDDAGVVLEVSDVLLHRAR